MEIIRPDFAHDTDMMMRNRLENAGFFPCETHLYDELWRQDPNLSFYRNTRTGQYRIVDQTYYTVMQFEWYELGLRIIDRLKRIDSHNGWDATAEIKRADEVFERENARKAADLAQNFAEDTLSTAKRMAYYGG